MSKITKDRAIEKIKKCLALSASSEPHEAAAAMKQARALMVKYQVSEFDVEASKVELRTVGNKYSRLPSWYVLLINAAARAFKGMCFTSPYRLIISGQAPAPELIEYCIMHLERTLIFAAKDFSNELNKEFHLTSGQKREALSSFRHGWMLGVYKTIIDFAAPLSEAESESLKRATEQHLECDIEERKSRSSKKQQSTLSDYAETSGYKAGKAVSIHHGVGAGEKQNQARLGAQ